MIFVKCGLEHEHVEIICNMIEGNVRKIKNIYSVYVETFDIMLLTKTLFMASLLVKTVEILYE